MQDDTPPGQIGPLYAGERCAGFKQGLTPRRCYR